MAISCHVTSVEVVLINNMAIRLHSPGMGQLMRFPDCGQYRLQHKAERQHDQEGHTGESVRKGRAAGHGA